MHWTRAVRYSSIAVEAVAAALILSIAVSGAMFAAGIADNPGTSLSIGPLQYSFSGYNLTINSTLHMDNRGIYPVHDPVINYVFIHNYTVLAAGEERMPDIAGSYSFPVSLKMDMKEFIAFAEQKQQSMLFHPSVMQVDVNMSGYYGLGLTHFSVFIIKNYTLQSPIVYYSTGNYTVSADRYGATVYVPYTINTASYLSGSASFVADLMDNGTAVANASSHFPLGQNYSSQLQFTVPPGEAEKLNGERRYLQVSISVEIFGENVQLGVFR